MTSDDLTPEQARRSGVVVGRHLRYLGRLRARARMQRRGFPYDDPLVLLETESWEATHTLSVRLHYLGVASGAGKPPRE